MILEARDRIKKVARRVGMPVAAVAFATAFTLIAGPLIVAQGNAQSAEADRDFRETSGVDLVHNPETNVYSALTRPSSLRAGSQQELMRGIMQRVVRESGCDVLSITYIPEARGSIRDPNRPKDLYQIPVLCRYR